MNDPTISAKRVRQIGEELWLLARYLEAEQGQIGWVSTCEAWSEQLRLLADHMGRAVAPPGGEPEVVGVLRDVQAFLDAPADSRSGRRDYEHIYLDEPLKRIRERIDSVLVGVSRPGGTPE